MDQLQAALNNSIDSIKQNIDPNDRKVQVAAAVSAIAVVYMYIKLTKRRNFWDEMPKYAKQSPNELGDPDKLSSLKRCAKPQDSLEIVFSKTGPGSIKPITMQQLWQEAVAKGGDEPFIAVEQLDQDNNWKYVFTSWRQADNEFNRIARSLIGLGINPFDIINIIGSCSPMFHYIFFGIILAGAIPGGCYTTNNAGPLKYICNLCKTVAVFAEDRKQLNKYMEVIDDLKTVKTIIVYDDDEKTDYEKENGNKKGIKIIGFKEFMALGEDKDGSLQKEVVKRGKKADPKQCLSLIYTSGTTGGSKGCMLSHDNIFSMCHSTAQTFIKSGGVLPEKVRMISFLPLSHIAGQVLSWWNPVYYRVMLDTNSCTFYCRKDWKKTMKMSLATCEPTAFISVPRMYEKFYEAIIAGLANASFIRKSLFNFVLWIGKDYYYNTLAGGSGEIPNLWGFVSKKLCDGAIKKKIGFGACTTFASGGGPLANKIRETFAALNMPIVDAYGMSETAGAIAISRPNNFVPNACGPVAMGSEIIIDHKDGRDAPNEGEICVRGRSVMMGYINEIEKTEKTFDDEGFIHTGDIGYIDKYDCLHITGRIKELLITAGGENVAPVPVENFIKKVCPALSQAVMIGDKKKYCTIIVSIATEEDGDGYPTNELQAHAKLVNPNVSTVEEAMKDEIWYEYLRKGIQEYNGNKAICVSNSCRIQYFQILHRDLSVADGTLAASLKVKRHKLYDVYKKEIDALYGDSPSVAVNPRR